MQYVLICVGLLLITGCSASMPLNNIIQDQQFKQYQSALEQVESDYLRKKITYVQYLEQKNRIETDYQRQIDSRRTMIQNQNAPSAVSEMLP